MLGNEHNVTVSATSIDEDIMEVEVSAEEGVKDQETRKREKKEREEKRKQEKAREASRS